MNDKDFYHPISRQPKLSDQVEEEFIRLIERGELRPGNQLAPERELADRFTVSRTVIREAIRSLAARGVIEVRPGSGAVIVVPETSRVAKSMSLILRLVGDSHDPYTNVFEARRVLEVEIAGLAAKRATQHDLDELAANLEMMRSSTEIEAIAESDVEFHAALARATHNEIFSVWLDSVVDIMLEVRRYSLMVSVNKDKALRDHQAIYDFVAAHNSEGACEAMETHLRDGEQRMRDALRDKQDAVQTNE